MPQAKYFEAPAVAAIADELIEKFHHHLIDFSVKIRYLFTDKTQTKNGKEVWGNCRKVTGMNAYLGGDDREGDAFFVIIISKDVWDVLPPDKRIPLVDHYLCHAYAEAKQQKNDGDGDSDMETDNPVKLSINPYDIEEYSCIARRYGFWRDGIQEFVDAALKSKTQEE